MKASLFPLVIKASYYNPRESAWEPIIEEMAFNIDYVNNPFGSPK